jgi:hypothetical protein
MVYLASNTVVRDEESAEMMRKMMEYDATTILIGLEGISHYKTASRVHVWSRPFSHAGTALDL